ncbi:MAG: glycosyltransferase [Gammaproteobacteria bacterium]
MSSELTIGLATYNGFSTIAESIESLLSQTYTNFKLLVSDDASSDNTLKVIEEYAKLDRRIQCIKQHENLGPLGNFRKVLDMAETKYFMWASQDDLWSANYLEESVSALSRNPHASYTIPKWVCVSRRFPVLRRVGLPCMKFLESEDPFKRVLEFTKLPFMSFKDNITYGVYRTAELARCTNALKGKVKYFSIGGVHNEFNVLSMQAIFTPAAILQKRYRNLPPGHCLEIIVDALARVLQTAYPNSSGPVVYPRYSSSDYLYDLKTVLNNYGVPEDIQSQIIVINEDKIAKGKL